MSDRGFLFLFSLAVIVASLGAAGWLLATGQAGTVDGLFLFLTCLIVASSFGLYVSFLIRRAMAEQAPAPKTAKVASAAAAKAEPVAHT